MTSRNVFLTTGAIALLSSSLFLVPACSDGRVEAVSSQPAPIVLGVAGVSTLVEVLSA